MTSNVGGPARMLEWHCLMLYDVLPLGVCFGVTDDVPLHFRLIQALIILLCSQRHIPFLLPCPEPRPLPNHALYVRAAALDCASCHWEPPKLLLVAEEVGDVPILTLHLRSIAAVLEGERACAPRDPVRSAQLLVGEAPGGGGGRFVADLHLLAVLSLQHRNASLARRFLTTAALCDNSDLVCLTDELQVVRWSRAFPDKCAA